MHRTHLWTSLGHGLALPTVFATAFCVVVLALLVEATNVALFAGDKRAERALKIIRELLSLIRRWPR